jgi:hypothetical protein
MVALCAMASFAVDMGRVVVVKTQLRAAADAAALGAARYVLADLATARNAGISTAHANFADGSPVILASSDIEFIRWDEDTRTYVPASSSVPANAVKVTVYRTTARGNPVKLPFAQLIGANTCNVTASAIALATPQRYAAVGLDFISMSGNATNAYRSNTMVTFGPNFTARGDITSNGDITLGGSSFVDGNAFPGVGKRVIGSNHVSGYCQNNTEPLVYPVADPGNAATVNDNGLVPSNCTKNGSINLGNQKKLSLPGGTYYFKDLEMGAGSELTFTGPSTLYLTGNVRMDGHAITNADLPKNLRIVMLGAGTTVEIKAGTDLFADIYAPLSAIYISGNGDIYGAIVGKSITMSGEAGIHYDMSLLGGVSLVK